MKKLIVLLSTILVLSPTDLTAETMNHIRINQLGYLTQSVKTAVFVSRDNTEVDSFELYDALTDKPVYMSYNVRGYDSYAAFTNAERLSFSDLTKPGAYYIVAGGARSPSFRVGDDVYDGTADFLLRYMRQQRCGYNPFLKDSCHVDDGFLIYHPTLDSTHVDVTGGWHDATDYLQYVATSANAVHQMLFAYWMNPGAFGDAYDVNGDPGANGIPDVLDEAKWGLDWLVKMNPEKDLMFNQIADDRDHVGFRLPTEDKADYGKGPERPVYVATGEVQGLFEHKNRTTGIASTAGKFASAFALGADVLRGHYPEFAEKITQKAVNAYDYGLRNPGACQTAPGGAPYFYEEDNWVDDMELAAVQLGRLTGEERYYSEARDFGRREPVTPWMTENGARHYQYYPFTNVGHPLLTEHGSDAEREEFAGYIKLGMDSIARRGQENPFLMGIPYIWCSSNLVSAFLTQCLLYREATGDDSYIEMEAAMRDWLFGCNPWGTSMIVGLPSYGDYPDDTHSSLALVGMPLDGGLVDGPVFTSVYDKQLWIELQHEDEYAPFQSDLVVYHDDFGDYSTNEPTMDGTATLFHYLSALQTEGMKERPSLKPVTLDHGGVIRTDTSKTEINLVFTAHTFVDGYDTVRTILKKHGVPASFFFTGIFYRMPEFAHMVTELRGDGHYIGAHSNMHILYAPWDNRDSTLVSHEVFLKDIRDNYAEMAKFGITKEDAPYYMPPFEWYNTIHSEWCRQAGLTLINLTPGTWVNQDWTIPDNPDFPYYSSDNLYSRLMNFEKNDPNGLNGTILLVHFGTDPRRTDKFYDRLDSLITELKGRGYRFTSLTETIGK